MNRVLQKVSNHQQLAMGSSNKVGANWLIGRTGPRGRVVRVVSCSLHTIGIPVFSPRFPTKASEAQKSLLAKPGVPGP